MTTNDKGVKVLFCDTAEEVSYKDQCVDWAVYRLSKLNKPKIKLIDRRREYEYKKLTHKHFPLAQFKLKLQSF